MTRRSPVDPDALDALVSHAVKRRIRKHRRRLEDIEQRIRELSGETAPGWRIPAEWINESEGVD